MKDYHGGQRKKGVWRKKEFCGEKIGEKGKKNEKRSASVILKFELLRDRIFGQT